MAKDGAMPQNDAKQMQKDILASFGFRLVKSATISLPETSEELSKLFLQQKALLKKFRYINLLECAKHQNISPMMLPSKKYQINFLLITEHIMVPFDALALLKNRGSLLISMKELIFLFLYGQESGLFPENMPIFALNHLDYLPVDDEGHRRIPYVYNKQELENSAAGYGTAEDFLLEGCGIIELLEIK